MEKCQLLYVIIMQETLINCVDRAIVLSNGKIIVSGSPQEIINDAQARSVSFGEEFKIKYLINAKTYLY